ncbi:MAG: ATP-binding cassette domain-containing protein [Candidatus Ozemobacteraceae bacterium]
MIRFEKVSFRYQDPKQKETSSVFEEVSFCFKKGERAALIGTNGSGKSTLAMCAAGLLLPTAGEVSVNDISTKSGSVEIQRYVGLLFQNSEMQSVGITVEEDLAFGLENMGVSREEMRLRIQEVARSFGLVPYLSASIHTLSGGIRQKLSLAGVLVMNPDFIILDEPTSHLDPWARKDVWEEIERLQKEHGIGVLLISQSPYDLERVSRILVLHQKCLVFDGPADELWKKSGLVEWGIPIPEGIRLKNFPHD